jgi:xanthine dehydrogenase accessory factor
LEELREQMKKADGTWERIDDYVLDFAVDQAKTGYKCALMTLVRIEGSFPRPVGSQMTVSETGQFVGYLSGGCIERAIVAEALDALRDMRNR